MDSRDTGAGGASAGVGKIDVTDVIFYGISHILPLVSGLLEFPKLSNQFFDLVGYIVETYPEKLNGLPPDFFEGLIGSLLWGISNVDVVVGKNCLKAIEEMTKDHVRNNSMVDILAKRPEVLKACMDKVSVRESQTKHKIFLTPSITRFACHSFWWRSSWFRPLFLIESTMQVGLSWCSSLLT